MEDALSVNQRGSDDVIVLSSEDEDKKERLTKVTSKQRQNVRRRLLQKEEMKIETDSLVPFYGHFGKQEGCLDTENTNSDNESLTSSYSDDLTVTQFESATTKVFTPTKKPRTDTLSDCSDNEAEKEGYTR